ncbi:MAG: BatA domain-containing protein [Elusimicrobia bacterium]|nr:BatA domain-containing protein [Elusimicrobiota bacterium]
MFKFLNPSAFYFLPLITIPILIHLLTRKKAIVYFFPTILFLKKQALLKTRQFKLLNILLLILRTLIVLLFVLFFAKPSVVFLKKTEKGKCAIFLDISYSMNMRSLETSLFKDAVKGASEIGKIFGFENTNVFTFAKKVSFLAKGNQAFKILEKTTPVEVSQPCEDEIEKIVLENRNFTHIFILSDFCKNTFKRSIKKNPEQEFFCFKFGEKEKNSHIKSIKIHKEGISAITQIQGNKNFALEVYLSARKINQAAVVDEETFLYGVKNVKKGKLELSPTDALKEDNIFYFSLPERTSIKVFCFNGDYSLNPIKNETYFLRKIFDQFSLYELEEETQEKIFFKNLKKYRVCIFTNPHKLNQKYAQILRNWILRGGIVFIFPGERTDVDSLNNFCPDFLPSYIYPLKEKSLKGMDLPSSFWLGDEVRGEFFEKFKAEKFFPVLKKENSLSILKSKKEDILVFQKFGEGFVFLFSVPADLDFSNLAILSGFPVFLLKTLDYFLWERKEFKRNYFIGDVAKFKSLSSKLFFKGHPIPLSQEEENGALILKAPPFANTGFYTVKTKDGEKVIAVNLRRGSENNLERLSDSEIKKIFDDAGIFKIKNPADEIPVILSGKPVGKYIIILILLFLIAEVILANKL